jgi:hypothetical protein
MKAGAWRLVVIPGDHQSRRVHARLGTGRAREVVIELRADGTSRLREADGDLSHSKVREAMKLAQQHFGELVQLWDDYC